MRQWLKKSFWVDAKDCQWVFITEDITFHKETLKQ